MSSATPMNSSLPLTFTMPADTGLIVLGAIYCGAIFGGSISAILLSIPGAPGSIATLLDGYPMSKKGQAQEALYTTFVSSLVGGVVGALALIFLTPPMARFALQFGPSELFWTTVFGITVIAGLSSGAMVKGLFGGLGGTLGMFLLRHKTKHWYFRLGFPALLAVQVVLLVLFLPKLI